MLWPGLDESAARRNLRRELARLREAGAESALRTEGGWLLPGPVFESNARAMHLALDEGWSEDALALCRGPLAHGLVLADAPDFDDWLTGERAQAQAQALRCRALASSVALLAGGGQFEAALSRVQALPGPWPCTRIRPRVTPTPAPCSPWSMSAAWARLNLCSCKCGQARFINELTAHRRAGRFLSRFALLL